MSPSLWSAIPPELKLFFLTFVSPLLSLSIPFVCNVLYFNGAFVPAISNRKFSFSLEYTPFCDFVLTSQPRHV